MTDCPLKWNLALLLIVVPLMISGCYKASYFSNNDPLMPQPDGTTSHVSTAFGVVELSDAAELRPVCPGGVSLIEMEQSTTSGLIHYVTLGNYSQQTSYVWCKRRLNDLREMTQ